MKIYIVDTCKGKFSGILADAWKKAGHEVKLFYCLHLPFYAWADVVYFDFVDSNVKWLSRYANGTELKDGIAYDPKKIHVARCVDIDAYSKHPGSVDWTKFDACIFISEHIRDWCNRRFPNMKDANEVLIRCGVDTERFSPGEKEKNDTIDIGWVGRPWIAKHITEAFDVVYELKKRGKKVKLHLRTDKVGEGWWEEFVRHKAKVLDVEDDLIYYDFIEDMSDWYRKMDYVLVTSMKEAFSYTAGEGASCGIQPIILNSPEMDKTWPKEWLYNTSCEAAEMMVKGIEGDPRQFIIDTYPLEKHVLETSNICKIPIK